MCKPWFHFAMEVFLEGKLTSLWIAPTLNHGLITIRDAKVRCEHQPSAGDLLCWGPICVWIFCFLICISACVSQGIFPGTGRTSALCMPETPHHRAQSSSRSLSSDPTSLHSLPLLHENKQTNKQTKTRVDVLSTWPGETEALRDFSRHPWHEVHGTPKMVPAHKPPVPHRDLGTQHGCLSSFLPFTLSSKPSWKKWKADFLLFSRGRRERKKTPQASGQLEATESSGKGSLAGLYNPISRWIVYF